jgi:lipoprotein-releasing system ATP-binding protein
MTTNNTILKATGITKTYRLGAARIEVLKGVDIAVARGDFVAITGTSGSGKSTLLHILGALDTLDAGRVEFEGDNLAAMSGSRLNHYRNKNVGFVFQFYHLLDELNVMENAILPAMTGTSILGWLTIRNGVKKRAAELLDRLGLGSRLKHKPYQLSGGERQRVAIARALMNQPVLLLADEPTGNLDSATGNGILEVFDELNKAGQTIMMVTHDSRIAQRAKRTVRLADGRII